MLFRWRRYRVFVVLAVVTILIVARLSTSRSWRIPLENSDEGAKVPVEKVPVKTQPPTSLQDDKKTAQPLATQTRSAATTSKQVQVATSNAASVKSNPKPDAPQVPEVILPDRKPLPPTKITEDKDEEKGLHAVAPPGRQELPTFSAVPTTIHWVKQPEHFPVPTAEIIRLPTGQPLKIPKIQHSFNDETTDAKLNREQRQTKVREEFQKAWGGYKTKAWMHDELMPKSGAFKDPFCGWAATLVDGLDTLWIMGLHDEFEKAVKAVELLDFTTTPRRQIPVFETTIRYLGGLIAAYDVSGHKYKILLDKAVELAEILMGTFDTPNRMPVLSYLWKPTYASQPKMAGGNSNLAELGSLSMEFTRLAQLTQNSKYYDAVARVTNALSEWQDRGTALGGVFPDNVDASGCNRSVHVQQPMSASGQPAVVPATIADSPTGYKPENAGNVPESKPQKQPADNQQQNLAIPGSQPDTPGKGRIAGWDEMSETSDNKHAKRDGQSSGHVSNTTTPTRTIDPITGLPLDIPAAKASVGSSLGDWDCQVQGLQPASAGSFSKFSMGGGQDSTYEYFPKQHLLLGGLEPVYKKMYLKTIDDIKKYMLYRPMVPDNRDILFSGSVTTRGNPEVDAKLSADVEHLTCFIGGMVGMAAKIFDLDKDLEIAKRLTDGCVWAYESTATGIMPEGATVYPCESVHDCTWNQTAYYLFLDPLGSERDVQVQEYMATKAKEELDRIAAEVQEQATQGTRDDDVTDFMPGNSTGHDYDTTDPSRGSKSLKKESPISLQKRQDNPKKDLPKSITHNFKDDIPSKANIKEVTAAEKAAKDLKQKSEKTEAELDEIELSGRKSEVPLAGLKVSNEKFDETVDEEPVPDPWRPLNHTEYVESRIKESSLPPGFVTMQSREYILRPEAIESVWYMYRLTGDPVWQDKGWTMFKAIINATSVKYGHSAIHDVTASPPYPQDSMESFWLAETLKYFYLLFSTPDTISLDEWVLNTEAHPFLRPS